MKKLLAIAVVAAAAAIAPTTALAGTFSGVVVGKAPGSLAVASKSGAVKTVFTRASPRIGSQVAVNGSAVRVVAFARRVRIHAVIVRRSGATTFLAGGHSLFAVRTGRTLASVVDTSHPGTGAVVNTTAQITPTGQLNAIATTVVGQQSKIEVEAKVLAVSAGAITLSVNGQAFTIPLPAGIQLPASLVGQTIKLELNLANAQPQANEDNDDQNDDNNDQNDNNDDNGNNGNGGGNGQGGGGGGDDGD